MCPVIEVTRGGTIDVFGKFLFAFMIEHLVGAEPDIHAAIELRRGQFLLFEPEFQDGIDSNLVVICNRRAHAFAQEFYRHFCGFPRDTVTRPNVLSGTQVTIWAQQAIYGGVSQ